MNFEQTIDLSPLCLPGFLELTLCGSPVAAEVIQSDPTNPVLFDYVIDVPHYLPAASALPLTEMALSI